jgi:hypothetical protein
VRVGFAGCNAGIIPATAWASPAARRRTSFKKDRPVAAIHYRNRSDSFQSRHKAGAGNRRVAMASCRSKVRVAVRALIKRRERIRRRVRRVGASIVRA